MSDYAEAAPTPTDGRAGFRFSPFTYELMTV